MSDAGRLAGLPGVVRSHPYRTPAPVESYPPEPESGGSAKALVDLGTYWSNYMARFPSDNVPTKMSTATTSTMA